MFQISRFFADPRLQTIGEFLIDLEADPAARAIATTELRIDLEADPAARAIATTELRIMNRKDG